ncbi:MAG: TetR/AcrR family transcriptional regulator [Bacteroidales bacterium]|nr:TetR/AcrR family transcriptional regulator [Bacteroidales bacterium]
MARKGTAKEVFIQRTLDLFMNNGVRTTMDEISRQLKISKRTIYEQFDDKTDLLRACVELLISNIPTAPETKEDNVVVKLYTLAKVHVLDLLDRRSSFTKDLETYYPDLYQEMIAPLFERRAKDMMALFKIGIEQGIVRDDINLDMHLQYLYKFFLYVASERNLHKQHTQKDIFQNLIFPLLRGIMTEKGLRELDGIIASDKK